MRQLDRNPSTFDPQFWRSGIGRFLKCNLLETDISPKFVRMHKNCGRGTQYMISGDVLLGIPLGVITTIITLAIFQYAIAPAISFSQDIRCYYKVKSNRYSYSVRIKKSGSTSFIDTRTRCVLHIRDVNKSGSDIWNSYNIPTTFAEGLIYTKGYRIIHLKLHEAPFVLGKNPLINSHLFARIPEYSLRLEDIFYIYPDAWIRVYFLGHDHFTGVKKLYLSPKYRSFNVQHGNWSKLRLTKCENPPL